MLPWLVLEVDTHAALIRYWTKIKMYVNVNVGWNIQGHFQGQNGSKMPQMLKTTACQWIWCILVVRTKKPVTTMLTYPWKCTVLHCNHLGNTWKPLVLMTRQFDYCPSASEGDNQSVRSSAPVVSRCFPGGYNVKLYISRGRLAWWWLAFLRSGGNNRHPYNINEREDKDKKIGRCHPGL